MQYVGAILALTSAVGTSIFLVFHRRVEKGAAKKETWEKGKKDVDVSEINADRVPALIFFGIVIITLATCLCSGAHAELYYVQFDEVHYTAWIRRPPLPPSDTPTFFRHNHATVGGRRRRRRRRAEQTSLDRGEKRRR